METIYRDVSTDDFSTHMTAEDAKSASLNSVMWELKELTQKDNYILDGDQLLAKSDEIKVACKKLLKAIDGKFVEIYVKK